MPSPLVLPVGATEDLALLAKAEHTCASAHTSNAHRLPIARARRHALAVYRPRMDMCPVNLGTSDIMGAVHVIA